MAHPKRKISKQRARTRRTHYKAVAPTLAICPNCGAAHIYPRTSIKTHNP
jgi:large subunit ribosomal protein L32